MANTLISGLDSALQTLRQTRPTRDVDGLRQSRRVSGFLSTSIEGRGFRHLFCYMEKGLCEFVSLTANILQDLAHFMIRNGCSDSRLLLASFGGTADPLVHVPKTERIRSIQNALREATELCRLAGDSRVSEFALLKTFDTTQRLQTGFPGRSDVLAVFRSRTPIFMMKHLRSNYISQLRKHSLWVTLQRDAVGVELGFVPDEWSSSDT